MFDPIIKNKIFSKKIYQYLSEITGEYKNKPVCDRRDKKWVLPKNENIVTRLLERYRDEFDENRVGYAVYNLIEIIKSGRGELSGCDLGRLNLKYVKFNECICNRYYFNDILTTNFNKSLIDFNNFFRNGHVNKIIKIYYIKEEKKIITISEDKILKEWDITMDICLKTCIYSEENKPIPKEKYSFYDRKINNKIENYQYKEYVIEMEGIQTNFSCIPELENDICYSENGNFFFNYENYYGKIYQWDVLTGRPIQQFADSYLSVIKYWNPSRELLLSGNRKGEVKIWGIKDRSLKIIKYHKEVTAISYKNKEYTIIVGYIDGMIKVWDILNNKCIMNFKYTKTVTTLEYVEDLDYVIAGYIDGSIIKWDMQRENDYTLLKSNFNKITAGSYSNDRNIFISGDSNGSIKQWDTNTGKCIKEIQTNNFITKLEYSESLNTILVGHKDGSITEWNIINGMLNAKYTGHPGFKIVALDYSPQNKCFLSSAEDWVIKEWDIEKKSCVNKYIGNRNDVELLKYTPTGNYFLSVSFDGLILKWKIGKKNNEKTFLHYSLLQSYLNCKDNKCIFTYSNYSKTIPINRNINLDNHFGLIIQNCTFKNLHPDSKINKENKELMQKYGAIFD